MQFRFGGVSRIFMQNEGIRMYPLWNASACMYLVWKIPILVEVRALLRLSHTGPGQRLY